ncbi:MAG: NAD(P)/FAD-dependent oxidoreductase [Actinomycetia bacterium]|nr:NAD(P)/FAD-dependent oxidoreductase [Actinomycetes bacterium]
MGAHIAADAAEVPARVRIVIVGAGLAGLGAAMRLLQAGIDDFVVLERADAVGGTWRDNDYPGCAVDVPSAYYSYSFAPKHDWSHAFARQPELLAYLQELARRPALAQRLYQGCALQSAAWNDEQRHWKIVTSQGTVTAQLLVPAVGIFNRVSTPDIPGLESFTGKVFHTTAWDHDYEMSGRRVAVIGTGSTAAQVIPEIAPRVGHLTVFQRSAGWVIPRIDWRISAVEKALMKRVPGLQRIRRWRQRWYREMALPALLKPGALTTAIEAVGRWHLRRQVHDPSIRRKLTPTDRFGCKRPIVSSDYLSTFARPNVDLVTEPIVEVRERGIVTADGCEHPIDALVLATGFKPYEWADAAKVVGRGGLTLDHDWREHGARSYLGGAVHGFPNLFYVVGPNTAVFTSILFVIEAFIDHFVAAVQEMDRHGLSVVEARADAQEEFGAEMDQRMTGTVWTTGCTSWLLHESDHNSTLWPSNTSELAGRLKHFDPLAYDLTTTDGATSDLPRVPNLL